MVYDYDKLYRDTPAALGAENPDIAAFFDGQTGHLRVLDLGCGQGRDALPAARRGHAVIGVDLSPSGIDAMLAEAQAEGLAVTGHAADIREFAPDGPVDVLLIDRTLHMLDRDDRHRTLARLLPWVAPGGWLLLVDEPANMADLSAVLDADRGTWQPDRKTRGLLFARRTG